MYLSKLYTQVQVVRGMGLPEEAHRALVEGTLTHPHSHSLWLLRLKSERERGREAGRGGEKEEAPPTEKLVQLCSNAVETIPAEVGTLSLPYYSSLSISYRTLCAYGSSGWTCSCPVVALPQKLKPLFR